VRIAAKDLESALKKKGFRLDRQTDDKIFYFYYKEKKTSIHTKLSHGKGEDLRDKLIANIKRQMCLDSSGQVEDFAECSLTEDQYIEHLIAKQIISTQTARG
jgi:hypothetical protein